eukprot:4674011-Amphidinium_carterae.2
MLACNVLQDMFVLVTEDGMECKSDDDKRLYAELLRFRPFGATTRCDSVRPIRGDSGRTTCTDSC